MHTLDIIIFGVFFLLGPNGLFLNEEKQGKKWCYSLEVFLVTSHGSKQAEHFIIFGNER